MSDLTPEEIKFFETGDASALGVPLPEPVAPEPVAPPPPAPAPAVAAPPPVEVQAKPDPAAELAAQLAADRQQLRELQRSIAALSERVANPPPPPTPQEPPPDKKIDPLGAMFHEMEELKKLIAATQQSTQQAHQLTEQERQLQAFKTQMNSLKSEFVKTAPDFDAAYAHLRAQRAADLADVGVPEHMISHALMQDEIAVSQNAVAQGKNPAQVIYNMAKRYGYTPKAATPPAPTPEEKIAKIVAGQQAADVPGRAAPVAADMTLASLKDASDSDLNKVAQDDALWRKVMGGGHTDIFRN